MGTRSQQASKSGGRNLSWCGKHRQQGRLAAIQLEKEIKYWPRWCRHRFLRAASLVQCVSWTLERIMQQDGSASFGAVFWGFSSETSEVRLGEGVVTFTFTGTVSHHNKHSNRGLTVKAKPRRRVIGVPANARRRASSIVWARRNPATSCPARSRFAVCRKSSQRPRERRCGCCSP